MNQYAGLEKLKQLWKKRGREDKAQLSAELNSKIGLMMETANQMILRLPEAVQQDIATCCDYVDVNNRTDDSCDDTEGANNQYEFTISYDPVGLGDDYSDASDDVDVLRANDDEKKALREFTEFLYHRYGFLWNYSRISIDERCQNVTLVGTICNKRAGEILKKHLRDIFSDKVDLKDDSADD